MTIPNLLLYISGGSVCLLFAPPCWGTHRKMGLATTNATGPPILGGSKSAVGYAKSGGGGASSVPYNIANGVTYTVPTN